MKPWRRTRSIGLLAAGVCGLIAVRGMVPPRSRGPRRPTPVAGLTPAQQLAFAEGSRAFAKTYEIADGLGPVFNESSCAACHPHGGGSIRTVTRFGRADGDVFDPLETSGGSLAQARSIGAIETAAGTHDFAGDRVPRTATIVTLRRAHTLQGLGFVDAVPDDEWEAIAREEAQADPSTAGRVNVVFDREQRRTVGKFGWKAQSATLAEFSGDALRNEIGITNPLFRDEVCPQGDCASLAFNPVPALNDDGRDVEALATFITMLAPPPRGSITGAAIAGERVFERIGCAACHRPTLRTGPSPIAALDRVEFHPYSDFLLHDMGTLGDRIVQGAATGREMRTQPLWGLRPANRLLHDSSAQSIEDAIRRHDGQGRGARDRFNALDRGAVVQLLAFLKSL
jgi:CxxC motif-containing protein (DUF1111 family)